MATETAEAISIQVTKKQARAEDIDACVSYLN
jgi:hypothetical protein